MESNQPVDLEQLSVLLQVAQQQIQQYWQTLRGIEELIGYSLPNYNRLDVTIGTGTFIAIEDAQDFLDEFPK